jgi:hypothetical protein
VGRCKIVSDAVETKRTERKKDTFESRMFDSGHVIEFQLNSETRRTKNRAERNE